METGLMKTVAAFGVLATCLWAHQAPSASGLFQSGVKKETVDGNLAGAIEDYKKAAAAAKTDRALAARSLLHLAQCYRKLGDAQAKSTLERIVRDYGDQPPAAQARAQLAILSGSAPIERMRLQKLLNEKDQACSSVSADGRLLGCAVGWIDEAAVYEVETGKLRVLTSLRKENPANRFINTFSISPNGKWMALHIYRAGGVFSEISIVATDGSGPLKTVFKHPSNGWLDVATWTPDSREILFTLNGDRGASSLPVMTVDIATGATRQLRKISGSIQWVFTAYSPDGKWLAVSVPGDTPQTRKVQLWSAAGEVSAEIAELEGEFGTIAGWSPDGKFLILRGVQSGEGDFLSYPVANGKVTGPPHPLRTTVERFSRSKGIDAHGNLYFTGERTESRIFTAGFDQSSGVLTGHPFPIQSHSATDQGFGSWSPDGSKFASWSFHGLFARVVTKPKVIVRGLPSGPETVAIPELTFFPQHVPTWDLEGKHLLMLIGDSGSSNTRLASLEPATGKVTPVSVPVPLANINRTPDWSRDGRFLFQRSEKGDLYQIDAQSGTQKLIYKHPPEESGVRNTTVSPDGKMLAFFGATRVMKSGGEWTSTSHWWIHVLELETGAVRNIEIPHAGGWGGSVLAWSPDAKFLVYAVGNEKLPSLWSVPSDGSAAPKAITDALGGRVMHIGFTADGRTISYSLMKQHADIWMMSNFLEGTK